MDERIQFRDVRLYFGDPETVTHYANAAVRVGLWASERKILTELFNVEDPLLELGCGAGRISIGLYQLGYRNLLATDLIPAMVEEGKRISETMGYDIDFQVADATRLSYADNLYRGVIFGFNGLMQIPGSDKRKMAMREIYRVLSPGGILVFTSHDRSTPADRKYWEQEAELWRKGRQNPRLLEYGDLVNDMVFPPMYIHIPDTNQLRNDLTEIGFHVELDVMRSIVANESQRVREFSDECRFWIVRKPE